MCQEVVDKIGRMVNTANSPEELVVVINYYRLANVSYDLGEYRQSISKTIDNKMEEILLSMGC